MPLNPAIIGQLDTGQSKPFDLSGILNDVALVQQRRALAQEAQQRMNTQAKLQQLAQQYGDDPDELVKQLRHLDPEKAADLEAKISDARYKGSQAMLADLKSGREALQQELSNLQGTDETTWGPTLQGIIKRYPQLTPVLAGRPFEDKDRLIGIGQSQDQWLADKSDAIKTALDGTTQLGAAKLLAAADTPLKRKDADALLKSGGYGMFSTLFPDQASAQAYIQSQQKEETDKLQSPEVEAIKAWTREHSRQPTQKELEEIHKGFKEAGTIVRVSAGGTGAGALTPGEGGGLELAGTMTRLLGRIPIGMARGGNNAAILNEAARQNKVLGQSPVAMMQRAAMYQGDVKALANLQKMQGPANAYEQKALGQLDIVDNLSDKVGRSKIPLLNRAIIAGKTEIAGDPDATLLLNAIMTASTEYAKIMMGGTGSAQAVTDSAQREAQKLLNASMNKETLRKATQLMRQEMNLTMRGYDAAISHIGEQLGQGGAQIPTAMPAPTTKSPDYRFNPATGKLEKVSP